ncbi:hypothetical protein [Amycolatopsis suaedae]|uniref:Uncharacterized protein n=1 Tax=Amycolatopsis suaedae TaxID=2510978 RepID=A0A4Q7JEK5_9PSEU|nr:hypothetical protein [Amycolatopsis suaedae]RZQ65939.1 hypothetical protein EWH70_02380 [Amycolatopsis suaedae]
MTTEWALVLPGDLDDYDWAVTESRGVLLHAVLQHGSRRFPTIVYDPYRIVQDAALVTGESGTFYEPNVILVSEVTQESIRRDGDRLLAGGHLDWLLGLAPASGAEWSLAVPDATDWTRVDELGTLSAELAYGERRFPLTFFDLERLAQAVGWDGVDDFFERRSRPRPVDFHEDNVIVLPALTRHAAKAAVEDLTRRGEFDWLLG